jgi:hypothetical protein
VVQCFATIVTRVAAVNRDHRRTFEFIFLNKGTGLLDKPPYDRLPDAEYQRGIMRYCSPIPQRRWRSSVSFADTGCCIQAITTRATIEAFTDVDADS